ncbi:MAG: YiiX/YebB-like N1pC/P60 family cysteine hydrolase [Planctomycetaceae bacterium]
MKSILLASVLSLSLLGVAPTNALADESADVVEVNTPQVVANRVSGELQTGTLIFSEGDCLAVRVYTNSPYTHVGAIVVTKEGPIVYDSMNGVGVRKLPLVSYFETQAPDEVRLFHPKRKLTAKQSAVFEQALEAKLGQPYSISHFVSGERCEGLHCSEYVTDALMSIQLVKADRPPRVSPASLVQGITQHNIYSPETRIELVYPEPPAEQGSNCCEQWWIDTKRCTSKTFRKLSGWFLCR